MKVKLHTKGKILNTKDELKYIFIKDDTEGSTGGYYIHRSEHLEDVETGYDLWIEKEKLEKYIKICNWKIKWLDEEEQNKE